MLNYTVHIQWTEAHVSNSGRFRVERNPKKKHWNFSLFHFRPFSCFPPGQSDIQRFQCLAVTREVPRKPQTHSRRVDVSNGWADGGWAAKKHIDRLLLGWAPRLLGWRPWLLGWRPWLLGLEAMAIRLEAMAIRFGGQGY